MGTKRGLPAAVVLCATDDFLLVDVVLSEVLDGNGFGAALLSMTCLTFMGAAVLVAFGAEPPLPCSSAASFAGIAASLRRICSTMYASHCENGVECE